MDTPGLVRICVHETKYSQAQGLNQRNVVLSNRHSLFADMSLGVSSILWDLQDTLKCT